ncbi:putative centrosomal protein [Crotalus adamanteus]|uniref:Centrosomal protein n=1 Tax=Crotalus adamanteus TaxID=8729 RepID=A0AAW1CDI4_CROAD
MIFVGRDDCELMLQSRSVDKQHAVINYDASADEHLVKDLGSLNGTFRVLHTNLFTVVRGELRVPEEALKHEKFTSQLQLSQKSSEVDGAKLSTGKIAEPRVQDSTAEIHHKVIDALKSEDKSADLSGVPRGTPLYGQPSWWGDDETEEQNGCRQGVKPEEKAQEIVILGGSTDGKQAEEQSAAATGEEPYPFCREPSYFEIPTKEAQQHSQTPEGTIHEIPTKDTYIAGAGHASFTIEFDNSTPGKVTIKDHVTKFTPDQRPKPKKSPSGAQDLSGLQTVMMAPESKVANWLAQNNPPTMMWEASEEDSKSIKSDVPVYLKRLKGNKHDDGTQSDSENVGAHKLYRSLGHRPSPNEDMEKKLKTQLVSVNLEKDDDDQSDKGTYTIELENPNAEEMEARKMIDKESTGISGSKRWVSQWASLAANHTKHEENEERMESSVLVHLENDTDIGGSGLSVRSSGSITSLTSLDRKRRTLPQLPKEETAVIEGQKIKVTAHHRSEIDSKSKSLSSAHNSPSVNSRWRRFPTDYASTSEDEFGSNRNSPKHARLRTSPALKTTRVQNIGTPVQSSNTFKHRIKEQEDYIRDWTAHREEIARISQDLALIAREINDVAGEIDSVTSSGTAPSTTVSTAATTPGSAIDTREEVGDLHGEMHKLVDRVFDESLNFRKIPPVVNAKTPDGNIRPNDPKPQTTDVPEPPTITRRRTWSRDEVMGDTLLLSSVFQFSRKIRQSIDKTAGKIRILFKDKDRNWEDIEKKLRAESDIPIVKTSSMEISSILQELKRVEKQLQVINSMIDPDGTLDALSNLGFAGPVQAAHPKQKSIPGSQSAHPQIQPNCLPEARAVRPATASTSSELGTVESEHDFSIHFNRFNPDGEEEDPTLCK